ncbi:MAG: ribonuclease H-like domain-containing protein [Promethearchaeota archaeon]
MKINKNFTKYQTNNVKEIAIKDDVISSGGNCPLFNSFTFVKGIGIKTETTLRELGIHCWNDVIKKQCPELFPKQKWYALWDGVNSAIEALKILDISQLTRLIPKIQQWKMIPNFIDRIAYLDIETTGLSPHYSHITTIAVYDGTKVHDFVRGDNLHEFPAFISKFPAITTFYGKAFDIPFIKQEMGIDFTQIHFDVCFLLRRLKIKGGLKKIEKRFGISRGALEDLDGYSAVLLWKKFKQTKKIEYLETLLAYNNEDVINLEFLLHQAYNLLIEKEQVFTAPLEFPKKEIKNPFYANKRVVREILGRKTSF